MRILVSACLLGLCTRFDGASYPNEDVIKLRVRHLLVPACPEQLAGLPTPRPPCELSVSRVISRDGQDMTEAFLRGAAQALQVYMLCGCEAAVLKQRSPSCGKGLVYDGSFQGNLVQGPGLLAKMLMDAGIPVYGEDEAHRFG
jgi:uncharacterized protein YbbK (DUF523 family)